MEQIDARRSIASSFIENPQRVGSWSLRIQLSNSGMTAIGNLLNFTNFYATPALISLDQYNRSESRGSDRASLLLPRLFSYLRACLPQKTREGLPRLYVAERLRFEGRYRFKSRRSWYVLEELGRLQANIAVAKKRQLSKAANSFKITLARCSFSVVPSNPSKMDFFERSSVIYFQAFEEPGGVIRILSPYEDVLRAAESIFRALPQLELSVEVTKVFSPEEDLMEQYLPVLGSHGVSSFCRDLARGSTVAQILDEVREERFVHAIRASGIAVEELLVEIYETFTHEKAPEMPLGNLLSELAIRTQEIVVGASGRSKQKIIDRSQAFVGLIKDEKGRDNPNPGLLATLDQLQKILVPALEDVKRLVSDFNDSRPNTQRLNIFPQFVHRCLSELIPLRNQVSHRVARGTSISSVNYIDAAVSLRSYLVLTRWWESERGKLDYKVDRKTTLDQVIERSKTSVVSDVAPLESAGPVDLSSGLSGHDSGRAKKRRRTPPKRKAHDKKPPLALPGPEAIVTGKDEPNA